MITVVKDTKANIITTPQPTVGTSITAHNSLQQVLNPNTKIIISADSIVLPIVVQKIIIIVI